MIVPEMAKFSRVTAGLDMKIYREGKSLIAGRTYSADLAWVAASSEAFRSYQAARNLKPSLFSNFAATKFQ